MTNAAQTPAEKAFEFMNNAIALGKTVYVSTCLRSTAISPKTVAKFESTGNKVYKLGTDGDLYMASGKNWVCIATKSMFLTKIEAM